MTVFPQRDTLRNYLLGASALLYFLALWLPSWFTGSYGYFIDEFYYIACAARPSLGYVDHPPLAPVLLAASGAVLGYSLPAVRLLPCLAAAAVLVLTALMTRRLGGSLGAEFLAVLATALSPVLAIMLGFYSTNAFEILFWVLCSYLLLRIVQTGNPRLWLVIGAFAGLGLLNKHTMVLFAVGLGAGLIISRDSKHLFSPWLWGGALLAGVLFLPNLVWQISNDWPSLEFYRNAAANKNQPAAPWVVVLQQLAFTNPGSAVVWMGGIVYFLREQSGRFRLFGWMYLTMLALLVVSEQSRPDRIAGIYPLLLAGGGVFWADRWSRHPGVWTRRAVPAAIVLFALIFLPISLPVLPPAAVASYASTLGIVPQIERGSGKATELPQWFADRRGWEEYVADVERAVAQLSEEERAGAIILTPSYGHAGSLELLGSDLPPVASAQNTYYLWGLPTRDITTIVSIGFREPMRQLFNSVEQVGTVQCSYCMKWRNGLPIFIARDPKALPLREVWHRFKHFE